MNKLVGITGSSCSGKSTLCRNVQNELDCIVISLDDFFKNIEDYERNADGSINFDHPNNICWDELFDCLIKLQNGQIANIPIYEKGYGNGRMGYRTVEPKPLIIVEGYMLFINSEISNPLLGLIQEDSRFFIDLSKEEQQRRRLEVYAAFRESIDTFENIVFEAFERLIEPTRESCGQILDGELTQDDLKDQFIGIINNIIEE